MKSYKSELLKLSKISPNLIYSPEIAKTLSGSNEETHIIINEYFSRQPKEYLNELQEFEKINGSTLSSKRKAFIFVTAFNEEKNLTKLIDLYFNQTDIFGILDSELYEICFVINYPQNAKKLVNDSYATRFESALEILIRAKEAYPNIHIISKEFESDKGSLGRARKYGMDYCLLHALRQSKDNIDNIVIISNEGDTLDIPKDYINSYIQLFRDSNPKFSQGRIDYPDEIINISEAVRLFVNCREAVHFGQGLASQDFPFFDGIMPVGRNFGVSPRICAQVGGIDPIRRTDTDDDLNFGTDIHVLLGEDKKSISNISLTTNPRREVSIVRDIILGKSDDCKKSYENFHENRNIYDFTYEDVVAIAKSTDIALQNREIQCELVNQYFQWVLISRYKANLNHVEGFDDTIKKHCNHEISYWEKERKLCDIFENYLQGLNSDERRKVETFIVKEALYWFNKFVEPLGVTFDCENKGLKSTLK